MPNKPEKYEIQRELPANLLIHMPRKRLPRIVNTFKMNTMEKTSMDYFYNRKTKKIKLMIDENNKNIKSERDEIKII